MACNNVYLDFTATLLLEVHVCPHDVNIEHQLQPLSGEKFQGASTNVTNEARLDVSMSGFWDRWGEKNFIDVRVFNPLQLSIITNISQGTIRILEQEKKCHYETRIFEVEYSPLVFSVYGGMAPECYVYKRLASMLAEKNNDSYADTM